MLPTLSDLQSFDNINSGRPYFAFFVLSFLTHPCRSYLLLTFHVEASPLEARALHEASPAVVGLLYQLGESDGELDPLRVIEKAATGSTTVTVADTIAILRFCPKNAASLVQQVDPQEEKCVAKDTSR